MTALRLELTYISVYTFGKLRKLLLRKIAAPFRRYLQTETHSCVGSPSWGFPALIGIAPKLILAVMLPQRSWVLRNYVYQVHCFCYERHVENTGHLRHDSAYDCFLLLRNEKTSIPAAAFLLFFYCHNVMTSKPWLFTNSTLHDKIAWQWTNVSVIPFWASDIISKGVRELFRHVYLRVSVSLYRPLLTCVPCRRSLLTKVTLERSCAEKGSRDNVKQRAP